MTDLAIVRRVIDALWSLGVILAFGTVTLIGLGKPPEAIAIVSGLAGTSVGALASLLVSTRSSSLPPPPPSLDAEPR